MKLQKCPHLPPAIQRGLPLLERDGEGLQARISGELSTLQQILHDEEVSLPERLKTVWEEDMEKVQRHAEHMEQAVEAGGTG